MARYNDAAYFFYYHAGYAYDPKTETPEQGAWRSARRLARAENLARDHESARFEWDYDPDIDSSDFDDEHPIRPCYICKVYVDNNQVANLGGIDLDPDLGLNDPYCRVIEAELTLEALED